MFDETQGGGGGNSGTGGGGKTPEVVPNKNIILRQGAQPITVDGQVNAGMEKPIMLPDEANQRAGWYHPRAKEIIALFPDRYAEVTPKG